MGVAPAAADLAVATHGQAVSYEFLLKTDPDEYLRFGEGSPKGQGYPAALSSLLQTARMVLPQHK